MQDAISSAEGPGSGRARNDLILYEEHLRAMVSRAELALAERRRQADEALAALRAAVKDRKVLVRLRDKKRAEHLREVERREQASNDESARRLWRQGVELPITQQVAAVLFESKPVGQAVADLMERALKSEQWT